MFDLFAQMSEGVTKAVNVQPYVIQPERNPESKEGSAPGRTTSRTTPAALDALTRLRSRIWWPNCAACTGPPC